MEAELSNWTFGLLFALVSIMGYLAILLTIFGVAEFLRRKNDDQKY